MLGVGGESTRPGASEVPAALEIARTCAVIETLAKELPAPISIDTRKAAVAEAALAAGARIVNDVSGLRHDPALARVAAAANAALVLGHLRGAPATMQREIAFADVVDEVAAELAESVAAARALGFAASRGGSRPRLREAAARNPALLANVAELRARRAAGAGGPVAEEPRRAHWRPAGERDPRRGGVRHAAFGGVDAVRVHDAGAARRAVALVPRCVRRMASA